MLAGGAFKDKPQAVQVVNQLNSSPAFGHFPVLR